MDRNAVRPPATFKAKKTARAILVTASAMCISVAVVAASHMPNFLAFLDSSGAVQTFNQNGALDNANPFFQVLGTNDRTCATCHEPSDGWSLTPLHVQARFEATQGMDPLFRPVDGANCPSADVSTVSARRSAYSMLLSRGVIRMSFPVPVGADFRVIAVDDPYHCPETTANQLAMFRRPLPATNLPFLTAVMWDGRESPAGRSLHDDLISQALDATLGHGQASEAPTDAQLEAIVGLEVANFTAQAADSSAGILEAQGANGGAMKLSQQKFFVGINDPLGAPGAFDPKAMTVFSNWSNLNSSTTDPTNAARASIARGEALFNTLPITISGVAGLNDKPGVPPSFTGTCTTCHNAPNVGDHSSPLAINIGVADYPALPALDTSGLTVYTIQCDSGQTVQTTDPGRALITGKCADIGKLKGPILRGLAARAPYFHNGSANTLNDVIEFYNERFNLNLTDQQKADLVAFLKAL
jgi:cytochrome c peroxidase